MKEITMAVEIVDFLIPVDDLLLFPLFVMENNSSLPFAF